MIANNLINEVLELIKNNKFEDYLKKLEKIKANLINIKREL